MKAWFRLIALIGCLGLGLGPVAAAETGLGVTPGSGQNLAGVVDLLGYWNLYHQICSGAAGATPTCATVNGSNQLTVLDGNSAAALADLATIVNNTSSAIPAGANTIGNAVPVAGTTGGALSSTWLPSAANTNTTNVKASAGTLYSVTVTQSTTTAMELKLYNLASAPTCSSATGVVDIIPIPSNATSPGFHLTYPVGRAFATGISFCLVAFGNPAATTDTGNAVVGATVSMTYD